MKTGYDIIADEIEKIEQNKTGKFDMTQLQYIAKIGYKYDWEDNYHITLCFVEFYLYNESYCFNDDWWEGQEDVKLLNLYKINDLVHVYDKTNKKYFI